MILIPVLEMEKSLLLLRYLPQANPLSKALILTESAQAAQWDESLDCRAPFVQAVKFMVAQTWALHVPNCRGFQHSPLSHRWGSGDR